MLVICNLYFLAELPDEIRKLQHIIIVSKETGYRRSRIIKDRIKESEGYAYIERKTWDDRSITRRENDTRGDKSE